MEFEQTVSKSKKSKNEEPRLMITRPLGPQGPKVGLQISGEEDLRRLDEELGKLSSEQRQSVPGIISAANQAEIPVVDS